MRFSTVLHSLLVPAVATVVMLGSVSCDVNDYCLNCAIGDGGPDDGRLDASDGRLPPRDGTDGGSCVPSGAEICDGKDNDCDGTIDNGTLPGVGDTCGSNIGECTVGTKACVAGVLKCSGVAAAPEVCDNKDNDCNGTVDNGDPGGGGSCGSNIGECVAGTNRCVNGAVTCIGSIGTPGAVADTCDGKDNDCDGMVDESLTNLGSCGVTAVGECSLGVLMCTGGAPVCIGDVGPTFELCDNLDQDCDGNNSNGFNLTADARNCGSCGNVCSAMFATSSCVNSQCAIGACDQNHYNINNNVADGCEYSCQFAGPVEACNGADDNCNGTVDENLVAPNICRNVGACAGTTATCRGVGGWDCVYGSTVSVDAMGDIIPETECDGIDNDCDGRIDEGDADKGTACGDTMLGVCRSTGVRVCDPGDKNAPTICQITVPGATASAEICDNKDNDCDGMIDDGAATGNLPGQEWVTIGGVQIMKYEASRPDATATGLGAVTAVTCSRPGVQPWVNIKAPQAKAACEAIGARLCSETEWQTACSIDLSVAPSPPDGPAGTSIGDRVFIEAEQNFSLVSGTSTGTTAATRNWTFDTSAAGFSGTGAYAALANTGANVSAANAPVQSPKMNFKVNFKITGNHNVWVRMFSAAGTDDTCYVGINAALPGTAVNTTMVTPINNAWQWVKGPAINVTAVGQQFVTVFMKEDGLIVDQIAIAADGSDIPPDNTNTWSYATKPHVASDSNCNAQPFDTNTSLPNDQDDIIATGSMPSCFANGPTTNDAFDMSGNVREWTQPRAPGANPLRGGASNTTVNGTTCNLDFTLADDNFFFPNVGFRCCR
jgi:hypothetical protein